MKAVVLIFIFIGFTSIGQVLKNSNTGIHAILEGDTLASDTTIFISHWSSDYHLNKQGYYFYQDGGDVRKLNRRRSVVIESYPHQIGIIDSNLNRITDTIYSGFTYNRSYPFVAGKLFIPRMDTLCLINKKGEEIWTTPYHEYSHFDKGVAKIALPEVKNDEGLPYYPILVIDTIGNIDTLNYSSSSKILISPPLPYVVGYSSPIARYEERLPQPLALVKIETTDGKYGVKKIGTNEIYLYPYYDSVKIRRISDSVFDFKVICRLNRKRIVVYI